LHVEARPKLLDQIGFQQQRLGFRCGRDDLDVHGGGNHAQDARRLRGVDARIGGQPLFDVFRLADIEHVIGRIEHAVDAGGVGGEPHRVFDRGMADRERAFGDGLGRLLLHLGQPCLVVLLRSRGGGIDVGRGQLRRQVGSGTAAGFWRAGRLRIMDRIVSHGLNLGAGSLPRQRGPYGARVMPGNAPLRMMSGR
jgi:hypothetical protein